MTQQELIDATKKAYPEAKKEINRVGCRLLTIISDSDSKIYLQGNLNDLKGKVFVYRLQLGNTSDFCISHTRTPVMQATSLCYASRRGTSTLAEYGGIGYIKPVYITDDPMEAFEVAKELRKLFRETEDSHFRQLIKI